MKISCHNCQSVFNIPEEKLPESGQASFLCSKCKTRLTVPAREEAAPAPAEPDEPAEPAFSGFDDEERDRAFDFIEEEGNTALICEGDPAARQKIEQVLELLEYHTTAVTTDEDALKKLEYHTYDMVILDEAFGGGSGRVLARLTELPMPVRRNILAALLTKSARTMDSMAAFHRSVNIVINREDIGNIGRILERSIAETDLFYQAYKDTLKSLGR